MHTMPLEEKAQYFHFYSAFSFTVNNWNNFAKLCKIISQSRIKFDLLAPDAI